MKYFYRRDYFSRRSSEVFDWWSPEQSIEHRQYAEGAAVILDHLRAEARPLRVLEVACGKGRITCQIPPWHEVIACDISPAMLMHLRSRSTADVVLVDAHALPFPADYFDVVICVEALVHMDDLDTVMQELARVVRASGRVFVSIDNSRAMLRMIKNAYEKIISAFSDATAIRKSLHSGIYGPIDPVAFDKSISRAQLGVLQVNYVGVLMPIRIGGKPWLASRMFGPVIKAAARLNKIRYLQRFAVYYYFELGKSG